MQVGHPVAKLRWFRHPLLTFTRRRCLKPSPPAPPVMATQCVDDEDCTDFLPWLEAKAGVKISSFLSIGKSSYGRSLFASKSIKIGDCMLKVPYSVQISTENGRPEINAMLDGVGNVAKLAILILVEQKIGQFAWYLGERLWHQLSGGEQNFGIPYPPPSQLLTSREHFWAWRHDLLIPRNGETLRMACQPSLWLEYWTHVSVGPTLPQVYKYRNVVGENPMVGRQLGLVASEYPGADTGSGALAYTQLPPLLPQYYSPHSLSLPGYPEPVTFETPPYPLPDYQSAAPDSEWGPYIRCLPKIGEMHNTIFWSDDELADIQQSTVYRETTNLKAQIEMEYLKIRPVLHQFPAFFEDIALKEFMHVFAVDFLNHDGTLETDLLSDEVNECSEVVADRNYAPGEQVLIRYGRFSNATLLLDFGFTHPHNIHDQVLIQLSIPHDDQLREVKLELLQRHSTPIVKDVNNLQNSWDTFTIKEVKCAGGKGKGIPLSLRAFSRVLCCTSLDELGNLEKEATQNDGRLARYPLKSWIQELKAHQILLSRITELMQQHAASIEALGHAYDRSESEKQNIRRTMAQDLLTGELRVMKSAKAWLDNYCASLTTTYSTRSDDHASLIQ